MNHKREDCALSMREHDQGMCAGVVDSKTGEPIARPVDEWFPPREAGPQPEVVYYTMRREDIGKSRIHTDHETIDAGPCIGRVMSVDVGRRLYGKLRIEDRSHPYYIWHRESEAQYQARIRRH